jgi:hypothetical protein
MVHQTEADFGVRISANRDTIVARRSSPQADLLAVLTGNDAIAIELDFVQPAGARRRPVGQRGLARQDEAGSGA